MLDPAHLSSILDARGGVVMVQDREADPNAHRCCDAPRCPGLPGHPGLVGRLPHRRKASHCLCGSIPIDEGRSRLQLRPTIRHSGISNAASCQHFFSCGAERWISAWDRCVGWLRNARPNNPNQLSVGASLAATKQKTAIAALRSRRSPRHWPPADVLESVHVRACVRAFLSLKRSHPIDLSRLDDHTFTQANGSLRSAIDHDES